MNNRQKIKHVSASLDPSLYTEDPDIIAPWLREWRDRYYGHTPLMLTPKTTQDVAHMVRLCANAGLKIVPQGGNTGLVGGQTPMGEVLLSTRRLNTVRRINPLTNIMTVEAGATLKAVQEAAEGSERKFPLSLASEGSCTIGGNLSTNAGGVHVLKYGTMKDLVIGIEAVLPNGDVFNGLTELKKDNRGYDLSRLFVGAEGTLGIITAASLKLFARPAHVQRVMVATDTIHKALSLLSHARQRDALSMFEIISKRGLDLVTTHIAGQKSPFKQSSPWYALIDWEVETEADGRALAEEVLGTGLKAGLIEDAVIASSYRQAAKLLALREHMSAAQKHEGGSVKLDVSVPLDKIPAFLDHAEQAVKAALPACRPLAFGHLGDGNIHYNISAPVGMDNKVFLAQYWEPLSEAVYDTLATLGGSISAEHGIGIMKKNALDARHSDVKIRLLKSVKNAIDPNNIMNPRVLI